MLLLKAVCVYLLSFGLKEVVAAATATAAPRRAFVYRPRTRSGDADSNCGVGELGMPSGHAMLAGFYFVAAARATRVHAAGKGAILAVLAVVLPSRLAGRSVIHVSPTGCHTPLQVAIGFGVGVLCGILLGA